MGRRAGQGNSFVRALPRRFSTSHCPDISDVAQLVCALTPLMASAAAAVVGDGPCTNCGSLLLCGCCVSAVRRSAALLLLRRPVLVTLRASHIAARSGESTCRCPFFLITNTRHPFVHAALWSRPQANCGLGASRG